MIKPAFTVAKIDYPHELIWIVDNDAGGMSLTNDAENVCKYLNSQYRNFRIFYRDTDMLWSEMVHDNGVFRKYRINLSKPELDSCPIM